MGVFSDISKRVETFWKKDKDTQATKLARGNTAGRLMASNSMGGASSYGYDTAVSSWLAVETDLLSRFNDYEEMDDYPEIATAIDIFADDSTQLDSQLNRTVWITSKDEATQRILSDMLHKRLRIDEEIWEISRSLCKYGNDYEELLVTNEGVVGLNFLPATTTRRVEDCYGALKGFIQTFADKVGFSMEEFDDLLTVRNDKIKDCDEYDYSAPQSVAFEDWEVVHFRLRSKYRRSVYGYSVLEPARWIWKRLMMMEDSAILFRLQKAMERYAFYVDVGDMPPAEALAYVNRIRQQYRKRRFVNPNSGKLELQFNPGSPDDDFWVPTRQGRDATRIDVVGSPQWQSMDDIEYFRDKLFAGIKVPKSYLAQEQEVARATLSSQDVRFARSVLRVQRELKTGIGKICRVHLAALGIDPARADFEIHMTVPSAIFELAQLEVRSARADLAARLADFVSLRWTLENILGLSSKEIAIVMKEREGDIIRGITAQGAGEAQAATLMNEVPPAQAESFNVDDGDPKTVAQLQTRVRRRTARSGLVSGPISEKEMAWGDPKAEKRAEAKLDQLLRSDQALAKRLREVRALVEDIRTVQGSPSGKS